MCFYYLPAFAAAFAAQPWRTPLAELRSESRLLGDAPWARENCAIWTWEFDPKKGNWHERIMKYHSRHMGKIGENTSELANRLRLGRWRPIHIVRTYLFFVSLDQFLLNGFQHGLCSAIAIRINSSTKWCWLWRCMALHSLYGKKGCSSRQENARDGSSDPHDPSPADGFSAGREHEKRSHMEDIAQKTSWKFKALATLFTFLQVFMA